MSLLLPSVYRPLLNDLRLEFGHGALVLMSRRDNGSDPVQIVP
jgi:hypothetical protein